MTKEIGELGNVSIRGNGIEQTLYTNFDNKASENATT